MKSDPMAIKLANYGVAFSGLALPAWWPTLQDTSETAASFVPILSALWLIVQIYRHLRPHKKTPKGDDS